MKNLIEKIRQLQDEMNAQVIDYGSSDDDIDIFAERVIELIEKHNEQLENMRQAMSWGGQDKWSELDDEYSKIWEKETK